AGRDEPSVVSDCALERARAFEFHKDLERTERALRHAVKVVTERQSDFIRANAVAVRHQTRMALATFLAKHDRSKEATGIAEVMVAEAQTAITKAGDQAWSDKGIFARRNQAGQFLARLQAKAGNTAEALASYAPLDAVLQQSKDARTRWLGSAIAEKPRQKLIDDITRDIAMQRSKLAMKIAELHRATNAPAALKAMQQAADHFQEAEKVTGPKAVFDLGLTDISIRQLKLMAENKRLSVNQDAIRSEIARRLKRVWKAHDSSGYQRRQAQRLWQRAKPFLTDVTTQHNSKAN
ncbi:MAG TPA: hypothetical protein VMX97_17580, partial [Hyphomicrobiaceae bacterium]|nr:hypothetical protein [Hyphomicrobiaceae bacterium]